MNLRLQSITAFHRRNAVIAGMLHLMAAIAGITALPYYSPLSNSGAAIYPGQALPSSLTDLLGVCTVTGTAIMLYPYLRRHHQGLAITYLGFRWLQAIAILIGVLPTLDPATPGPGKVTTAGIAMHNWTLVIGPGILLGINAFICNLIFYRSNLIPKGLASLGITASALIFIVAMLEIFHVIPQASNTSVLFTLPIFAYEMTLAFWLIKKGFNKHSLILSKF